MFFETGYGAKDKRSISIERGKVSGMEFFIINGGSDQGVIARKPRKTSGAGFLIFCRYAYVMGGDKCGKNSKR